MNNAYPAQVVMPVEWEAARLRPLAKERELTRARKALAAQRRRMPWLKVDQEYASRVRAAPPGCSACSRAVVNCCSTGRAAHHATTESADHAHHD